eukprot:493040-Hanusia_phi.AAC.2
MDRSGRKTRVGVPFKRSHGPFPSVDISIECRNLQFKQAGEWGGVGYAKIAYYSISAPVSYGGVGGQELGGGGRGLYQAD